MVDSKSPFAENRQVSSTFATLPALAALALQLVLWPLIQPYAWLLFFPAVFVSSWGGGVSAGIVSTALSTFLVWYFFIPPVNSFVLHEARQLFPVAGFVGAGVATTLLHDRMRKAIQHANEALAAASYENKKLNEAIQGKEAELASLLDAIPIAVFTAHDSSGLHITGNRAADQLLRHPRGAESSLSAPQEFRPRHFRAVKDGCDLPDSELPAQLAARGSFIKDFEFSLVFNDGNVREMLAYATPVRDLEGHPRGSVCVLVDITLRRQIEQELRARETQLQSFIQQAPASIAMLDQEMKYLSVSQRWIDEFGRGRSELIGLCHYDVHPDIPDRWKRVHRNALAGEAQVENEDIWEQADGTRTWLRWMVRPWRNTKGQIGGIVILTEDISARKAAEEALRDREARLATILNTAVDAIVTINEHGVIQSANPATEQLFGYTSAELLGQDFGLLMPSPYREEHSEYIVKYRQTGVKHVIGLGREVRGQRKDGTTFPIDLAVSEVDHLKLFTGIMRDLSSRRQLETEIVEIAATEQRRIGQDLHDSIGQQLTGLSLLAQSLAERLKSGEYQTIPADSAAVPAGIVALAERIQSGLEGAINDIRAICRNLTPVPFDSQGLMLALQQLVESQRNQHDVECVFDCPSPVTIADNSVATHLFQIAQGALSNALRHAKASEIRIGLEQRGLDLILTICDNGIGLSGPDPGNNGLGLRIIQHRAKIIGATFTLGPAKPTGTLFTCVLPNPNVRESESKDSLR